MKVLLTGANGYIGKRLFPILLNMGYEIVCAVRDRNRFVYDNEFNGQVDIVEADFLKPESLNNIPKAHSESVLVIQGSP